MENNNETLVLTPNEARKLLKCSRGTIYEALRANLIPNVRLGRKIIIPRYTFLKWLNEGGGNNLYPQK